MDDNPLLDWTLLGSSPIEKNKEGIFERVWFTFEVEPVPSDEEKLLTFIDRMGKRAAKILNIYAHDVYRPQD